MKVVVLLANGLRPSDLGAYGNEWLPTPNIDRFASKSVVFDQHFFDTSPFRLHARRHFSSIESDAAIAWGPSVEFVEYDNLLPPWNPPLELLESQFANWEFDKDPEPWLAPLPGRLDADDPAAINRLTRTHAAAVLDFDNWLGKFLDDQSERDLLIVTSLFGQNLGEHGIVGEFRPWLHEEFVHLPLLIRLPGSEQRGRRVWRLTQIVDIAPTIFAALGLPKPETWHGESLLPLCHGGESTRDYIAMAHSLGDAAELALQSHEFKLILPTKTPYGDPPRPPMFFVKPDDRWEVNDLRQPNLDYAEQLESVLLEFVAAAQRPGPLFAPPLPKREMIDANSETRG